MKLNVNRHKESLIALNYNDKNNIGSELGLVEPPTIKPGQPLDLATQILVDLLDDSRSSTTQCRKG